MEQNQISENMLKQAMRMGRPLPEKLTDAPELYIGLELYWTAFHELSSCRSFGWGAGPIPFTAILDYSRAYKFSEEQTEDLLYLIREMDVTYLDYTSKKQKREQDKKETSVKQKDRIGNA